MMIRISVLLMVLMVTVFRLPAEEGPMEGSGQLVLVVADAWESTVGTLTRLECREREWKVLDSWPVTLGHRGLGWGLGLHPAGLPGPEKREGDRRAPAGLFVLESAFGTKERQSPAFPYRRTERADLWVDDPASSHYNQWVRSDDLPGPRDWKSAEVLHREDGLYDLAVVVAHNRRPVVNGRGGAIFLHIWSAPGRSTVGCTAMAKARMRDLLGWLDASKRPLLAQVPRAALSALALPDGVLAAFDAPAASRR